MPISFETMEAIIEMIESNKGRFKFEWAVMNSVCVYDTETDKLFKFRVEELEEIDE